MPAQAGYITLPGTLNNYVTTSPLTPVAPLDVRCLINPTTWLPAADQTIIGSWNDDTPDRSWKLKITATTGALELAWSGDGTTPLAVARTPGALVTDGVAKWVRATLDQSGPNYVVSIYLSDDGSAWTLLGTTATVAGSAAIHVSTHPFAIGARTNAPGGGAFLTGRFYQALLMSNSGVVIASPDFTNLGNGVRSYTDAQGNLWAIPAGVIVSPIPGAALQQLAPLAHRFA